MIFYCGSSIFIQMSIIKSKTKILFHTRKLITVAYGDNRLNELNKKKLDRRKTHNRVREGTHRKLMKEKRNLIF